MLQKGHTKKLSLVVHQTVHEHSPRLECSSYCSAVKLNSMLVLSKQDPHLISSSHTVLLEMIDTEEPVSNVTSTWTPATIHYIAITQWTDGTVNHTNNLLDWQSL